MKPRAKVKPGKRTPDEYARIYGSRARVEWVKAQACVGCGLGSPCDNHHIENDGAGRKAAHTKIVPLCRVCHREYHDIGRPAFEAYYLVDFDELAAWTEFAWQEHSNRIAS